MTEDKCPISDIIGIERQANGCPGDATHVDSKTA
jgi:hypothetical protein